MLCCFNFNADAGTEPPPLSPPAPWRRVLFDAERVPDELLTLTEGRLLENEDDNKEEEEEGDRDKETGRDKEREEEEEDEEEEKEEDENKGGDEEWWSGERWGLRLLRNRWNSGESEGPK